MLTIARTENEEDVVANGSDKGTASILRDNNFDLIRLFAAFQVVLFHGLEHLQLRDTIPVWAYEFIGAFPGVPIFFFISGFLISAAYLRSTSLRQFASNRVLRIFPGLWASFIFAVLTVLIIAPDSFINANALQVFTWSIAQVSIAQFFNPEFLRAYGVGVLNGSLWTIPVELQFYCSIPIILLLLKNRRLTKSVTSWILLVLIGVFLIINQVFVSEYAASSNSIGYKLFAVSFMPYFWLFLIGVIAQLNFTAIAHYFSGKAVFWAIAHCAAVLLVLATGHTPGSNFPHPLTALTLCALTLSTAFTAKDTANRVLAKNDISYGVYIYHMIVVNAMVHVQWTGSLLHLVMLLVVTALLGALSWKYIEKPNITHQSFFAKWINH